MKSDCKTLIAVAIGLLIIATASAYVIAINWEYIAKENKEFNQMFLEANRKEVIQKIQSFKMKKLIKHRDLILRKDNFSQISNYQKYVIPDNPVVKSYLASNGITTNQQAYSSAVQWTWVSDQTLHGKPELWLMPFAFIQNTPTNPNNPVLGEMASDCESQVYTLVSILEAAKMPKTNVRVVVGEVNFSGEIGGHAWVQLYQSGEWLELEVTSGPFWDDDDNKLVENEGFSFNYFKNHPHPVAEYWAFFNDAFFYNPHNGKQSENLPQHWLIMPEF